MYSAVSVARATSEQQTSSLARKQAKERNMFNLPIAIIVYAIGLVVIVLVALYDEVTRK